MHKPDNGIEVWAATSAEMGTGNQSAIATPAKIDSNRPDATPTQFIGQSNHIRRTVTATKTVQDDGNAITGNPTVGLIIMDHQPIAIGEFDNPFECAVLGPPSTKQKRTNRLKMRQMNPTVGPEWRMFANQGIKFG